MRPVPHSEEMALTTFNSLFTLPEDDKEESIDCDFQVVAPIVFVSKN